MLIENISSSTTKTFNSDYFRQKRTNEIDNKGEGPNIPIQYLNQNEDRDLKENVKKVIEGLNTFLEPNHTSLKFELHVELNEYYVTIINKDTNEVIKEIPSKKILDIYAAMTEFLGFVVDKKI